MRLQEPSAYRKSCKKLPVNDNALLEAGIALCVMNFFCRFFVMHTGKFIKVSVSETLIEKYENAQGNFKIFMCVKIHTG